MTEVLVLPPDTTIPEPPDPTVAPAPEPVAIVPPAPAPEKRFEYQATDELGRPLGGKQVIVYADEEDLKRKWAAKEEQLVRKLREVTKQNRLNIQEDASTLPTDLDRMPATVNFKKRDLTPEERFTISQDLANPEKFDAASERLIEAALGAKPQDITDSINTLQLTTQQLLARSNAQTWMERNPEFYNCEENLSTVVDYMVKNGLQPTVKSFEFAQKKMQEAGLLLPSPIVREALPTQAAVVQLPPAPIVEPTRISEVPQSQQPNVTPALIPSGLNNRVSTSAGTATPTGSAALTLKDVDNMSSEEYRRRLLSDSTFVQRVNELEASRPPKPRKV